MLIKIIQKIDISLRNFLLFFLKIYRYLFSPWLGNCCRFYPTCSAYAMDVLHQHNTGKGLALIIWRLLRCHPFHPGGYDPVVLPSQCSKEIK